MRHCVISLGSPLKNDPRPIAKKAANEWFLDFVDDGDMLLTVHSKHLNCLMAGVQKWTSGSKLDDCCTEIHKAVQLARVIHAMGAKNN